MAKLRTLRKKKSSTGNVKRGFTGLLIFCLLLAGYSLWRDGTDRLAAVRAYVDGKQELTARFQSFRIEPSLIFWLRWYPAGVDVRESFLVNGFISLVKLEVVTRRENGIWRVREATLKGASMDAMPLSAVHVEAVRFFAASTSSAPLKKPEYAEGEDVHVVVTLAGLSALPVGGRIRQSIKIFDEDNVLVAELKDVAKSTKTENADSIRFSSLIEALAAGKYFIQFVFADAGGKELDVHWQEIAIKKISQEIIVKSVRYHADATRTKRQTEAEFKVKEMVYFSIVASGFRTADGKVAGTVDLVIKDERGTVVVNKPHFVAFNQVYKPGHDVVINGQIRMDEPGIYLFEFVINDFFTKRQLTQVEKITVTRK